MARAVSLARLDGCTRYLAGIVLVLLSLAMGGPVESSHVPKLSIEARSAGSHLIEFIVTNNSQEQISFDRYHLDQPFLKFLMVDDRVESVLRIFPVRDSIAYMISLQPGESYKSIFNLREYFLDFDEVVPKTCLVFFWTTTLSFKEFDAKPFFGGAVNVNCPNGQLAK